MFISQMTIVHIVMWETRLSTADLGYFKTQILQATLRMESQPQEVSCVFLRAEHLFQVSWMCKKQTSVSHSSRESEIISLDAGLRKDGLHALDLWDIVIEVLRRTKDNIQPGHTSSGKLGQIKPNHTGSGKLEYVQPNSTIL